MQTLADLNCKVLLEIGPQPVLTAAALRAWPDPATTPRAIASLRKNTADHRQITGALADAYVLGHLPNFGAVQHEPARKLDLPTYPFQRRQYWYRDNWQAPKYNARLARSTSETVRLLEEGRIDELVALLGNAGDEQQTVDVLTRLAAQHNQHRKTESIADARYEIRWDKTAAAGSGAQADEASTWLLISDDADVAQPLVDALTTLGHQHRLLGLPSSDVDEEQLVAALRAAAEVEPTLRIVHVAALESDTAPTMQIAVAHAAPRHERKPSTFPRCGRR